MSKKIMDDMEAMAKKYNPFKVRLGQVQTDRDPAREARRRPPRGSILRRRRI
jgi:hypothetical protein